MNILFDFITTYKATGASEYVKRVYYSLIDEIKKNSDIRIIGVYDSRKGEGVYRDISKNALEKQGLLFVDINLHTVDEIVAKYSIDKVFIGCAQYWGEYKNLSSLTCEIICVIHDLSFEEKSRNYVDLWTHMHRKWPYFLWNYIKFVIKGAPFVELMRPYIELSRNNKRFKIVAVSEYTKNSIVYNFNISPESITVLYSPEKVFVAKDDIDNSDLKMAIASGKKYFLLISANRPMKNAIKAINAFRKFAITHKDVYLITVGSSRKVFENQIVLPFLSESDLTNAYANCYAFIYPSLFEGFGYPPLEAMRFGKPVLSSNVCSMPEVLKEAPLYFSPFYDTDVFTALNKLTEDNYSLYSDKSLRRYKEVNSKQELDLRRLVDMLIK